MIQVSSNIKLESSLVAESLIKWLSEVCLREKKILGDIGLHLVSDSDLLKVNRDYLHHDYFTDIITFDYSYKNVVTGELWVSSDRVAENAKLSEVDWEMEFARIIVHGVLHLIGYKDSLIDDKKLMTQKENYYLSTVDIKSLFHVEQ